MKKKIKEIIKPELEKEIGKLVGTENYIIAVFKNDLFSIKGHASNAQLMKLIERLVKQI